MALIELKTNLKSLKYQGIEKPLITKDINDPPKTGGISMQANSRIDDVARLAKLMTKKQGLKFLGNQALLAQTNLKQDLLAQKDKSAKAIAKAVGNRLKQTAIDTVLATAGIIAQAPLNGTGGHIPRGINPVTYLGQQANKITNLRGKDGSVIPNGDPQNGLTSFVVDDNFQVTGLGDTSKNKYNNGEKWISQFGTYQRTQASDYINIQGNPTEIVKGGSKVGGAMTGAEGYKPLSDSQLIEKETTTEISEYSKGVEVKTPQRLKSTPDSYRVSASPPGSNKDGGEWGLLNNPIRLYNPGSRRAMDDKGALTDLEDRPDPIQSLALSTQEITDANQTDIVPFTFNVWTPGDTDGRFIYFRAFLDSFSDNFSGQWNSNKFIGRGDNLLTYNGFERNINFGFKIAAFSKADINPLYEKLNYLVGATAPTYSDGSFMKGTFVALTIGDYIVRQNGIIESIGLTWQTTYPWEIESSDDVKRVPHVLDVQVTFKPIHSFLPKVGEKFIYQDA